MARRIVSFLPSATEMVYALGLKDQLFGVTHECDYPHAARDKPVLVVGLVIQSMRGEPLDTRSPTSKLTLTLLAAVAQFEREPMLERQREGIKKAKGDGKYRGHVPTVRCQADEIRRRRAEGHSPTAIARELGVARSSVYLALKEEVAA